MPSLRLEKINGLIKKVLGKILLAEEQRDSNILLTISRVRVTPNLRTARVLLSICPENRAPLYLNTLNKNLYKIQGQLNQQLKMKPIPRIIFESDPSEQKAQIIEETLQKIQKENSSETAL